MKEQHPPITSNGQLCIRLFIEQAALASRVREVSVRRSGTAASRKPAGLAAGRSRKGLPLNRRDWCRARASGRLLSTVRHVGTLAIAFRDFGDVPRFRRLQMQKDALEVATATLNKLRETYHSRLDAGALAELDGVLELLKQQCEHREAVRREELESRVLRVIAMILRIVTNVADLMDRWH